PVPTRTDTAAACMRVPPRIPPADRSWGDCACWHARLFLQRRKSTAISRSNPHVPSGIDKLDACCPRRTSYTKGRENMTTSTVTDSADKPTSAPLVRVVKGKPSASEIAALTPVCAQLSNQARREAAGAGVSKHGERNLWGRPDDSYNARLQFNPAAFHNVRFY